MSEAEKQIRLSLLKPLPGVPIKGDLSEEPSHT